MEISYLGHSMFRIASKDATIVTDPTGPDLGLKIPKVAADIVTVSHHHFDHDFVEGVSGEPTLLETPGEFEVKGVMIQGIASFHDEDKGASRGPNTIYTYQVEGMRLAHLGDLGAQLSDDEISELGDIDILFIPVGGVFTIDAAVAVKVISEIEPKIVIPMHYDAPGLILKDGLKLETVDKFLKEIGVSEPKKETKYKIVKSQLPVEEMEIVVMTPASA